MSNLTATETERIPAQVGPTGVIHVDPHEDHIVYVTESRVADVATALAVKARVKFAVLELLREAPRTDDELIPAYCNLRKVNEWPFVENLHDITQARKSLADTGRIADSGDRRDDLHGRRSTVWEVPE